MRFVKEWFEKETNQWVLQFKFGDEEHSCLQKIETEVGKTISEMVNDGLKWLVENPEKAKTQLAEWQKYE